MCAAGRCVPSSRCRDDLRRCWHSLCVSARRNTNTLWHSVHTSASARPDPLRAGRPAAAPDRGLRWAHNGAGGARDPATRRPGAGGPAHARGPRTGGVADALRPGHGHDPAQPGPVRPALGGSAGGRRRGGHPGPAAHPGDRALPRAGALVDPGRARAGDPPGGGRPARATVRAGRDRGRGRPRVRRRQRRPGHGRRGPAGARRGPSIPRPCGRCRRPPRTSDWTIDDVERRRAHDARDRGTTPPPQRAWAASSTRRGAAAGVARWPRSRGRRPGRGCARWPLRVPATGAKVAPGIDHARAARGHADRVDQRRRGPRRGRRLVGAAARGCRRPAGPRSWRPAPARTGAAPNRPPRSPSTTSTGSPSRPSARCPRGWWSPTRR